MGIAHQRPAEMYDSAQLGSASEQSALGWVVELLPFFNETDILLARIEFMADVVDLHYVAEASRTHQGDYKPFHLDEVALPDYVKRYKTPLEREIGEAANWRRERFQRDILKQATWEAAWDVQPDDLVISCDLDEFVDPDALPRIYEACEHGPVSLGMRMIYYGNREDPKTWIAAKAFRAKHFPESLTTLRFGGSPVVPDCGWHLSYLGDTARRRTKVEAFLHPENRPGTPAWDRIEAGQDGPNGELLIDFDPNQLPATLRELVLGAS